LSDSVKHSRIFKDFINPLSLYNPSKPADRITFLWGWLIYPIIVLILGIVLLSFIEGLFGYYAETPFVDDFIETWRVFSVICNFLMQLRRLNDLGDSGIKVLLSFIPIINIFYFWGLVFDEGIQKPNEHISGKDHAEENNRESANNINEEIESIKSGLDKGAPVQIMYEMLDSLNLDDEIIKSIIGIATEGKLNQCPDCELVYCSTCDFCGNCGKKLTRVA
jgi:uncharacterized membrane protein YhaH (DUF805 family)